MERVSDQYLRLFIDQAPVSIAMFDREMRYLAASDHWMSQHCDSNRQHYWSFSLRRRSRNPRTLESGAPARSCRRDHSGRGRRV